MSNRDRLALEFNMPYRLTFQTGHPDIYVKSLAAIGPAARTIDPLGRFIATDLRRATPPKPTTSDA